ncbi:hypothetical protein EMCRGX_G016487 [Ephydatia muelleri]
MKDIPLPCALLPTVVKVLCANASNQFHQKAKQWVQFFLSIKEEGHQKKYVTPYMHAMVYHVPNIIRQYGNLKQFLCQGVEKHNDDAKRNYFSSNRWDAPADIMMTEYRLEVLQEYSRAKRAYTKRDSAYWHEGPSKLNVEKQYKGQQSLKVNYM